MLASRILLCKYFVKNFTNSSTAVAARRLRKVSSGLADVCCETGDMMADTTPVKAPAVENNSIGSAGFILLVEDDPSVRNLVTRLLTLHGYRVLAAENGRAAQPVWNQHRDEIALLLTDVVMPHGVSGRELALQCQAENARLRVIYTSGYNVELSTQNGWLHDGIHFLQKPYRPEQLLDAVRSVLSETPKP
jgi:CheY-like chemotaxis protein